MKASLLVASLLLLTILLTANIFIQPAMAAAELGYSSSAPSLCGRSCGQRCSQAGVKDRCLKYCGICCAKCKCVPSGTYGNKHQCPCYRDMRNSKGKPKCP